MIRHLSILVLAAMAIFSSGGSAPTVVDEYEFKMSMRIPRVCDNMESKGYRKYVHQTIKGTLLVEYGEWEPTVTIVGLENHSHKVNGRNVTYDVEMGNVMWHLIGDNATGKFKRASVSLSFTADPSYNIGDDEPDNTLVVTCSGIGTAKTDGPIRYVSGYVAGQLGCGCRAYSHVSPTRISGPSGKTENVVDIASTHGLFRIRLKGRRYK